MTTSPYLVLGIDTSGPRGGVALVRDDRVIAECELARGLVHGRSLVPTLVTVLAEAGASPADLDLVAVTRGPGSHTGLRVGLMAARTVAHVLAIPLVGIETVEALSTQAGPGHPSVVVAVDARLNRVFGGVQDQHRWLHAPALRTTEELAALVPENAILIGSGVPGLDPWLGKREDIHRAPAEDGEVRSSTVALLGSRHRAGASRPESVDAIYFTPVARHDQGS